VSDAGCSRPRTPLRRAVPWVIAALLLSGVGLPATAAASRIVVFAPEVGYAHPAGNLTSVAVNLTDQPSFSPSTLTTPAGSNLSVHLRNVGNLTHTFTVLAQPNVRLNASWSPTQLDQYLRANGTIANVSVAAGAEAWANLSFNESTGFDTFEFLSVVPYQFQAGMSGEISVTSTAPGLALSENTTVSGSQYLYIPAVLDANVTHFPVNLNILVTNLGSFAHTFTMVPQPNVTVSIGNYSDYFNEHAPLVNVNVPANPGGTVWANFTVKVPGVYMYLCLIPGHFSGGMDGYLYVGVPVPPPAPSPSTAIVETWVLIGSGLLLGVGFLVAALSSLVGRFPPKSPSHGHH
jgi:uncharacterized cupredoxin-like copper-binding protein